MTTDNMRLLLCDDDSSLVRQTDTDRITIAPRLQQRRAVKTTKTTDILLQTEQKR